MFPRKFAPSFFLFLLTVFVFPLASGCSNEKKQKVKAQEPAAITSSLEAFTESHTRVVWVQEMGATPDHAARSNNLRLMGYDSRDGRGIRPILAGPGSFAKPFITPSGRQIVYTDRSQDSVMLVNWDGTARKKLASGLGMAVWMDPHSGHEWVYLAIDVAISHAPTRQRLERIRIDKPRIREQVWTQTPVTEDQIQLSIDGKLAGGTYPWPHAGVAHLADARWLRVAQGCWPAISPDDQYLFWVFDGSHRNITMQKYPDEERWQLPINTAPGINGYEVYHPRWSNHPQFMVMTGPYIAGEGGNRIGTGSGEVSIYIGKFSKDFRTIEDWHRLTDDSFQDIYPDVWLASGLEKIKEWGKNPKKNAAPTKQSPSTSAAPPDSSSKWPSNRQNLALLWENAQATNQLFDPVTKSFQDYYLQLKGRARLTRHFTFNTARGGYFLGEYTDRLSASMQKTGELTLETVLASSLQDMGTSCIFFFGTEEKGENLALYQKPEGLVLQVRTEHANQAVIQEIPLRIPFGQNPYHLTVTFQKGQWLAYLNGQIMTTFPANVAFHTWSGGKVSLGADLNGQNQWRGQVEGFALYSRPLHQDEIKSNYNLLMASLRRRPPSNSLKATVRVIEAFPPPTLEAINPYQRALFINKYSVEKVIAGKEEAKEIFIAHWAIMDRQPLEQAERKVGEVFEVDLELLSDNPQLEGEKISMDGYDFRSPLYYDLQH